MKLLIGIGAGLFAIALLVIGLTGRGLVTLLLARARRHLSALMLLYPVTDHPDAQHPSYGENAVAPLQHPSLPPTLVARAEYDVLRDEGIAYANNLARSGVVVTQLHAGDMGHDFAATPSLVARVPQARKALADIARWLRATLHAAQRTTP